MLHEKTKVGDTVRCLEQIRNAKLTVGNTYPVVEVVRKRGETKFKIKITTDTGAPKWIHSRSDGEAFETVNVDQVHRKLNDLSITDLMTLEGILITTMDHSDEEDLILEARERLQRLQPVIEKRINYIFE